MNPIKNLTFISNNFDYPLSQISSLAVFLVCVTKQHTTFQYSSLVYGMCANLCFSSTRIYWRLINKNVIFLFLYFIFACRLVVYLYVCAVENPEFSGFCVSKSRGLQIQNENYLLVRERESQLISFGETFP